MRKKRRKKIRWKRVALVLAAVLIFIGLAVLITVAIIRGNAKCKGETDSYALALSTEAVVIRDETNYYSEIDFGRIKFSAAENSRLSEGQDVGVIYKLGYTDDVAQNLYNIQKEIYDAQMQLLSGINKPEIEEVQEKINTLTHELLLVYEGNSERTVREVEEDIDVAIAQRSSMLKNMVQPTEELNELYRQEITNKTRLDEWTCRVIAGADGVFSRYSDGFEQSLCMDKIDIVTASQVDEALEGDGYKATMGDKGFMYRIVDDSHFCIAVLIKKSDFPRLYEGEEYSVAFPDSTTYTGKCIRNVIGTDYVLCVMEIDDNVGSLMTMRSVNVTIRADFSGISVKSKAIKDDAGKTYVVIDEGGKKKKVYVDVLAIEKNHAIIRATDDDVELTSGQWFLS